MARWVLVACLLLSACGGGGSGSPDEPPPPPPPPDCCASTAQIAAALAGYENQLHGEYDSATDATADGRASNGTYYSGAHLEDVRDIALTVAFNFCFRAEEYINGVTAEKDPAAIEDMIEDYRVSVLDYILAYYDDLTGNPNWGGNAAIPTIRQEIINGVNAEFDQLQAAV